jgi:erythromycin esterase-like protein
MADLLLNTIMHHQIIGVDRVKFVVWAHNSHCGDFR